MAFLCLKSMRRKKNGQVMIFTALVVLVLVCFVASVVNVGQMIVQRIKAQNAADAAALTAGVWQARGLNLLQILNGVHWDLNYTTGMGINGLIPALGAWWPHPSVPGRAYRAIKALDALQAGIAAVIQNTQDLIVEKFPYIAVLHASGMAKDNGADPLLECLSDGIGSLPGMSGLANARVRNIFANAPIYAWTLYPSMSWPPDAVSLRVKKVNPGYAAQSPYEMCYNFTFINILRYPYYGWKLYRQKLGWPDDYYYDEDRELEPITFIAATSRKNAYILGGLFNNSTPGDNKIIRPTAGIASVETGGDDLDPSGQGGSWFINTPFFIFGMPLPLVRLITGYKGGFDTKLVPVKLAGGRDGETLLIYH